MSQAYRFRSKRRLTGVFVALGLLAALCLLVMTAAADTANGQSDQATPAAKTGKKKKKNKNVTVMTRNLYLGSDLTDALTKGLALGSSSPKPDAFADAVGQVLRNVDATDFNRRSQSLAKEIKKKRADLVGLQEAALWRIQIPTDGSPLNPNGQPAEGPFYDFLRLLVDRLNAKAMTKKQCKKKGISPKSAKCYRGYRLVTSQNEFDFESLADFNHDPGPDGKTFDLGDSASLGAAAPSRWLDGNDDPGFSLGEPTTAQCSDGKDNDGDGFIDYGPNPAGGPVNPGDNEESGPAAGDGTPLTGIQGTAAPYDCESRLDNSETDVNPAGTDPSGLPQDANFDHSVFAGNFGSADEATPVCPGFPAPSANCPTAVSYDSVGNGLDAPGVADCNPASPGPQDTSPDQGPSQGENGFPFSGYDGDLDPAHAGFQVQVCLFHGIDMDGRLTMRDAIIARKGAGVKTSNPSGGQFGTHLQYSFAGIPVPVDRGFNQVDANVRGKKFHFVNTHLEAFDSQAANPTNVGPLGKGSVRAAQARELVTRALQSTRPVILVGDLNSNVPGVQPGDEQAYQALLDEGFTERSNAPFSCCLDDELLGNPSPVGLDHQVDHIMTHTPGITLKKGFQTLTFANGLWSSDHAGVGAVLRFFSGKKKK